MYINIYVHETFHTYIFFLFLIIMIQRQQQEKGPAFCMCSKRNFWYTEKKSATNEYK